MFGPASPCDGTCRIELASGWCTGCNRTLAEIADWPMLSNKEKRAVLAAVEQRKLAEGEAGS